MVKQVGGWAGGQAGKQAGIWTVKFPLNLKCNNLLETLHFGWY